MRIFFFAVVSILLMSFVSLAADVCCEKTAGDEYCIYTDESNCATGFKSAAINCDQTSFCVPGCCYLPDAGECYNTVSKAQCDAQGGWWDDDPTCSLGACQKGCCLLSGEAFFVTKAKCKAVTSNYPDVQMTFEDGVASEQECVRMAKTSVRGCCVEGGKFTFTTQAECGTVGEEGVLTDTSESESVSEEAVSDNEITGSAVSTDSEGSVSEESGADFVEDVAEDADDYFTQTQNGFYEGMLCSHPSLNSPCAKQHHTGCVDYSDEVYWFDSCGNRENIYSSNRASSYNSGFVLSKEESCTASAWDPNCGNCDYSEGTLCAKAPKGKEPAYGEFICKSTTCSDVFSNPYSPNSGGNKKNGESWCLYDDKVGRGNDLVGSRHFRSLCVNGEVFMEPCADFREEICVQGVLGSAPFDDTYSSFMMASGTYSEALCRDNRWEDCYDCNNIEDGCGSDCDIYAGSAERDACCAKKCCENLAYRDCFWNTEIGQVSEDIEHKELAGICVPEVPPGLKFWGESYNPLSSSTRERSSTSDSAVGGTDGDAESSEDSITGDAVSTGSEDESVSEEAGKDSDTTTSLSSSTCEKGSMSCKVVYRIGGVERLLKSGDSEKEAYTCVYNCDCVTKDWVVMANSICRSQGDCGAYYNINKVGTLDGFSTNLKDLAEAEELFDSKGLTLSLGDIAKWKQQEIDSDKYESPGFWEELTSDGGWLAIGTIAATGVWSMMSNKKLGAEGFYSGITGTFKYFSDLLFGDRASFTREAVAGYGSAAAKAAVAAQEEAIAAATKSATLDFQTQKLAEQGITNLDPSKVPGEYNKWFKGLTDDALKESTKKGLEKAVSGAEKAAIEANPIEGSGLASTAQVLNTVAWIYTIYRLVDHVYADEKEIEVMSICNMWQAPTGGSDCEKCNEGELPCSEYRCKSYGQMCGIVNEGELNQMCVQIHPNDANSPIISADKDKMAMEVDEKTDDGLRGFEIKQNVGPFTKVTLAIKTNEPSQCKFDKVRGSEYSAKSYYFGDEIYSYNHNMTFELPQELFETQALKLTNGGTYQIYVRCRDASGNVNEADYWIKFKLKKGPDMTAPEIKGASITDRSYMPYERTSTPLTLYLSEKATCRWAMNDTDFELMQGQFSGCVYKPLYAYYECPTTLTGFANVADEQTYYFRCQDNSGNKNQESFSLTLLVSPENLTIFSLGPSGTFYDASVILKAITTGGAQDGVSECRFSTGEDIYEDMVTFVETDAAYHVQPLNLTTGVYNFKVICRDIAGNTHDASTTFKIEVDRAAPEITAIYEVGDRLVIEIDEDATCKYAAGIASVSLSEAETMLGEGSSIHELVMIAGTNVYSIACYDERKNQRNFKVYV